MPYKHVLFEAAAREKVLQGAGAIAELALENAVSVAGVLLLRDATMTEVEEPKPERVGVGAEAY